MKIICIGRNYTEHIEELQNEKPEDPVIFMKPDTAVLPDQQDFYIPEFTDNVHYETEVLVRISKMGKHIDEKYACNYYEEISLGLDLTARDVQARLKEKGLPWEKAKGFDGSAAIGNWVPKTIVDDVNKLEFYLKKNNEVVQNGDTSHMLWKIDELISYVSKYFTLKKGDVIFTGTPAGVGKLSPGDQLRGYIGEEEMFSLKIK
ncbi:fumarylacetoacetate hydrolase family protein [Robertkochia aurantiaca]|uniref:fumarylacetoacetate hydrolase family protein n=1 Tax=Robertkochia aurantiaca TaxID=2873700 RepID=UPI001CCDD336|nr:fumarylacetoacetate hydrolase family protein [Robertkochia sp. 3YJGBD-33]